ncbi:MAG: T9SS type A sorting domain-containing protein [Bacteroidia bacterium]
MKKLLLLIISIWLGSASQAQTYEPMVADSTLWKVHVPAQWSVYGYLTMGTSSYYGRTYYRLYEVGFLGVHSEFAFKQATSISQIGLLREEDKKVYYVPFQNGVPVDPTGGERFLYDFNVAEGDTVYSDLMWLSAYEDYYIVTNLDTVNGLVSHEALVPSVDSNFISNPRERIVHGQGLDTDPFGAIYGTALMANRSSSMTRGAEIFNQYFPVGVADNQLNHKLHVYPNPATERLFIGGLADFHFPITVVLHDLQGRRVLEHVFELEATQQGIELSQLPAGMYVLLLREASGGQKQLRFVKQ